MDAYALKEAFEAKARERDMVRDRRRGSRKPFSILNRARAYQPLQPANPRLRGLFAETVDRGMWRLLWIPPALSYYRLALPEQDQPNQ